MPFVSESQRRWMFANEPEMAKKWAKETPKGKKLPKRKNKYQFGGDEENPSDFFNTIADAAIAQQQSQQEQYTSSDDQEFTEGNQEEDNSYYLDLQSQIEELRGQLEQREEGHRDMFDDGSDDNDLMALLFSDDNNNEPTLFADSPNSDASTSNVTTYVKDASSSSSSSNSSLRNEIVAKESGGNYGALPKRKDGTLVSSAVGKYQFLWGKHASWIQQVTGVKSKEEFRTNPQAQEKAYDYWEQNTLIPQAKKIQKYVPNVSLKDIAKQVHFSGAQGAMDYYTKGKITRDGFGTTNQSYSKQAGGVAQTSQQQFEGLNNPNYDSMHFPMTGTNIFRGLDSGEPVLIYDETGKQKILTGNKQKAQFKGKVYELRLPK